MTGWPFGGSRGLRPAPHSTNDPVLAGIQVIRLEILAVMYENRPEELSMILNRLEIACLEAGRPEDAAAAHDRAMTAISRCGYAAKERWERSPRWFRALTRRFRGVVELVWEDRQYRRISAVIDHHLADVFRRSPRHRVAV